MLWLIIALSSYFLLALVALGDKYILAGPPNPKTYAFYVGVLGILALALIPFVGFFVPDLPIILLSVLAGAIFVFALYGLYSGLEHFEVSRIIPAIGGLVPLFTFGLAYFLVGGETVLSGWSLSSFILLLAGSVLITFKTKKAFLSRSLKISAIAAFLFALSFVLTKQVYLAQPFWNGFIWIRIGGFLAALSFIVTQDVRREIFTGQSVFQRKTGSIFILNKILGAGAAVLQNWAIALAGFAYLAVINALQGVQYVFLFVLAVLLSTRFPKVFKSNLSKKDIIQKTTAILLIIAGLIVLTLSNCR